MNNRGEIKVADFGMARHFADPLPPNMTQLVVTLWYRAPELLLGTDKYDQAIDMWSIGCIFGELLTKEPLLQGKNEVDELTKVRYLNRTIPLSTKSDISRYSSCAVSRTKQHGPASVAFLTLKRSAFLEHQLVQRLAQ